MEKAVKNYENYTISDDGTVKNKYGRVIKAFPNLQGYMRINLYNKQGRKKFYVHRLVAEHFCEGNRELSVNHKNGLITDNRKENLEFISKSAQMVHAVHILERPLGYINQKLTKEQVLEIDNLLKKGLKHAEIAKLYNVSRHHIGQIKRRKRWAWLFDLE